MTDTTRLSLDDLSFLTERGVLPGSQYLQAASYIRDGEFWRRWAVRALLAIAVGHILSGVIFFFAFNWNDLAGLTKFSIVGGAIAACLIAWILAKLDSPAGQACGIGATVLVGVMFAVLGQVYQTPAMIHTPFVFWALLTLPFALASRNLAHWAVWLVILTVAVSTYANSGLRLAGEKEAANLLNIAVAGGFGAGLAILDMVLSPRLKWARAEWFRVLLVLGAVGFTFAGFVEGFWVLENPLWLAAFGLIAGLMAYLYKVKPSLATLSLASFGLFTLVAQFGFRLFEGFGGDVIPLLAIFIWLGGLTIGLVALFRHYLKLFKSGTHLADDNDDRDTLAPGRTANDLSGHLGINSERISNTLQSDEERDHPWYMSMFLAIAGVFTAIVGCFFFGAFVGMILSRADEIVFGFLGTIILAFSIVLRRKTASLYLQHLLNTMIIVGGLLTAFGFGATIKDLNGIIALLLGLNAIVLISVKDRILEFLSAAAIITLIGIQFYRWELPYAESLILVIATIAGVVCLSRTIGGRLYKAAGTALLMAPAILGIFLVHSHRWSGLADPSRFSDDWPARIVSLIVLVGAVLYLNRGSSIQDVKPPIAVLVPLIIGASLVPLGGASALLIILAGYILGSRSLAIIGTLLQIYFLTMFYYDLSLDLLTKSVILFVSGLVFLAVWFFVGRNSEVPA